MICPTCDNDSAELFTWSWVNGEIVVSPSDDGMCRRCIKALGLFLFSWADGGWRDHSGARLRR